MFEKSISERWRVYSKLDNQRGSGEIREAVDVWDKLAIPLLFSYNLEVV